MEKQDCLHPHHRHFHHEGPKESILSSTENFLVSSHFHQDNRGRLLTAFKAAVKEIGKHSIIFLKGKAELNHHDDDIGVEIAQESNFHYLFGVEDNDCYAWINVDNGEVTLFAPKYPATYRTWMKFDEPAVMKTKYNVHAVHYVDEIEHKLKELAPATIYLYDGTNSDSGIKPAVPAFDYLKNFKVDNTTLYSILNECRVVKSPEEIAIMKFVNQLCSDAHVRVLRNMRPTLKEYQIESLFRFHVMERAGCRHLAYGCICASGEDAATLHYIVNDKELKDGAMMLNDMGSRYYGYCADITVTVPVNGKFTKHQAEIYNSVLKAQQAVIAAAKPGVRWDDMHLLAEKSMLADLIELGIMNKAPIEELVEARAGALFFPHGLGHLIGLNTHDVGGYNPGCPERSTQLGLKSLRTRRELKENMCITVEPGLYFIEYAIEQALKDPVRAKFYNAEKINEYKHVGGVRIEDVVVVTKTGMELLSDCPRTVAQIETCMAGKTWKDAK